MPPTRVAFKEFYLKTLNISQGKNIEPWNYVRDIYWKYVVPFLKKLTAKGGLRIFVIVPTNVFKTAGQLIEFNIKTLISHAR